MTQVQEQVPPRNPKAVVSLALGVTGVVFSPLLLGVPMGIAALWTGVVGRRGSVRRGMAAGGIALGVIAFVLSLLAGGTYVVMPWLVHAALQRRAVANLGELDRAAMRYAAQRGEAAPEHMARLVPFVRNMSQAIRDPRGGRRAARINMGIPQADLEKELDANSDFFYAAPGKLGDSRLITFYDKAPPGGQRLVAFADGRVVAFAPGSAELARAVAANNQARAAQGLLPLPLNLDGPPPVVRGVPASLPALAPALER